MTEHLSPQIRIEQILTAARKCFIQNGYFATKVLDIAEESGLSKGGIYFHFSSKREIFRALVEREYDTTMAYLDEVFLSDSSLKEKFMHLGVHFTELFSDDEQSRFMLTIGEMALRDDEVAKLLRDLQAHYYDRISQLLETAQLQNEINPINTYATSILLKALIDGIQLNFALGFNVEHHELIEAALVMLTQGLFPQQT